MRIRISCLLKALPLIAALMIPAAAWTQDRVIRKFDVSPGGTIEFDLESGGSLSIAGWDKALAEISYSQHGKGFPHEVEIQESGNVITVTSETDVHEGSSKSLSFEVRLPLRFDIEFESMGGELEIADLEGNFTGSTMGGGITLSNAKGKVRLKTMGGPIEVTDSELDGNISTMGGPVLLENVVGDLEATSMGGNVEYKNVRSRDGDLRAPGGLWTKGIDEDTVTITTMGGDISVGVAPEGAVVQTMGGDIEIQNASRFVRAKTMGGNIELEIDDGWVKATTMSGDINVVIDKGLGDAKEGVELRSCCGDITLTVPSGLSMDLDLTIAYTRNSKQDYEIVSDVDLKIERSKDWDYENGSPRKRIVGTAKVRGGGYPITIETVNGNIYLRETD